MCFFHYPTPKPRNKKAKKQASLRRAVGGGVVNNIAHKAADNAFYQESPGIGAAAAMYQPYFNHFPYGMEQYFKDEPRYITRSPWASPGEALDRALGTTKEVGKKVEELNNVVSDGVVEARAVARSTQSALKGARNDINHTHALVEGLHDSLGKTHDAIDKHYAEHGSKQDKCVDEIKKVRTMLEEDAKDREKARQRQKDMQEAWNYYQWLRQSEQEAGQKLPPKRNSSTQTQHSKSNTTSSYGRQAPLEAPPDQRKLRRSVLECLNQILGEAGSQEADRPERNHQNHNHNHNHNHFHAYAPPWGAAQFYNAEYPGDGWQQQHHHAQASPFPGRDDLCHDGCRNTHGSPGKRSPPRHKYNPFMHNAVVWGGHGPNFH
ncbi:hypothetical protein F5Y11DRAFT_358094 [Daldinia sp. FL1419]|nr:hypothetical protein F5Y11DRAFT_358094 [Daldinia sp. FL1419]